MDISLVYVFVPPILLVIAQLILKWQAKHLSANNVGLQDYLISLMTAPWMWVAVSIAGVAFVAWMVVLKKFPLSFAYPFVSLTFPLVAFASVFFLSEKINSIQIFSLLLIVLGVVLNAKYGNIS